MAGVGCTYVVCALWSPNLGVRWALLLTLRLLEAGRRMETRKGTSGTGKSKSRKHSSWQRTPA